MNRITNSVWLIALLSLVLGCAEEQKLPTSDVTPPTNKTQESSVGKPFSADTRTTDIYTQAATETCTCMQPMIVKALLLKKYQEDNQTADVKRTGVEMDSIHPQIQQCSDVIRQKYMPKKNSVVEKRMFKTLIAQCPNVDILFSYLEKSSN